MKSQSNEFEFIEETLTLAGEELSRRFGENLQIQTKEDDSIVTDADLASEKIILDQIRKHFPDDAILSEETGLSTQKRPPGGHIWIVDPLDGTTNFANNYPFFCVSIGRAKFRDDGSLESVLGGVSNPLTKDYYLAAKDQGAFHNGKNMRVRAEREFQRSYLVTGFYYQQGDDLQTQLSLFAKVAAQCQAIRRDGAAALDLALVASGVFDAFWETGLGPWDVAAGQLLVQEAGGSVFNYDKNGTIPYDIEGVGIIAGNKATTQKLGILLQS